MPKILSSVRAIAARVFRPKKDHHHHNEVQMNVTTPELTPDSSPQSSAHTSQASPQSSPRESSPRPSSSSFTSFFTNKVQKKDEVKNQLPVGCDLPLERRVANMFKNIVQKPNPKREEETRASELYNNPPPRPPRTSYVFPKYHVKPVSVVDPVPIPHVQLTAPSFYDVNDFILDHEEDYTNLAVPNTLLLNSRYKYDDICSLEVYVDQQVLDDARLNVSIYHNGATTALYDDLEADDEFSDDEHDNKDKENYDPFTSNTSQRRLHNEFWSKMLPPPVVDPECWTPPSLILEQFGGSSTPPTVSTPITPCPLGSSPLLPPLLPIQGLPVDTSDIRSRFNWGAQKYKK